MANTQVKGQPYYLGSRLNDTHPSNIGGPEKPWWKETASQSWGVGDLIYIDGNGTMAICTSTGSPAQHNSAIAGIATKAASGVTGANVKFRAIRQDDLFAMNVYHATAASAVTAQTDLGADFGIVLAGGLWMVDKASTVEGTGDNFARVRVVDFLLRNPYDSGNPVDMAIGDIYGVVVVQFLPFAVGLSSGDPNKYLKILQLS